MLKGFYYLALFLVANAGLFLSHAQNSQKEYEFAGVQGTIIDRAGGFIMGATITVTNSEFGISRIVQTDAKGSFKIFDLPPGRYQIRIEAQGFESSIRENVELSRKWREVFTAQLKGGGVDYKKDETAEQDFIKNKKYSVSGLKKEIKKNLPLGSSPVQVS